MFTSKKSNILTILAISLALVSSQLPPTIPGSPPADNCFKCVFDMYSWLNGRCY